MPDSVHRFPVLVVVVFLSMIPGLAWGETPEFSFFGGLNESAKLLPYSTKVNPESLHLPRPVSDPEFLSKLKVSEGEPLVLIRGGRIMGRGLVGSILAGYLPRAGDNRLVRFVPTGLPDSVGFEEIWTYSYHEGWPFPQSSDSVYDLYIIGDHETSNLESSVRRGLTEDESNSVVESVIAEGILVWIEFPRELSSDDPSFPRIQDGPVLLEYLNEKADWEEWSLNAGDGSPVRITKVDPFFIRISSDCWEEPVFLRNALDYLLRIDGDVYLVMRTWKPGSGAWTYTVYVLGPEGRPIRVHADGSWAT